MDVALSEKSYARSAADASRRVALAVFLGLTGVFLVSLLFQPPDKDYLPLCMFKALTGLPCPGCGLTHSFCALGKGRFAAAFGYNALGPGIFLLAVGIWLRSAAVILGKIEVVAAFDRMARRCGLARLLLVSLGIYGAGRIAFILIWQPELIRNAPLLRVITGFLAGL